MHRFLFCVLPALLCSVLSIAQPTYKMGLRGGINRATTTLDDASTGAYSSAFYSGDKSAIFGWQAGAVFEIAFNKLALQPALSFSQKGEQFRTKAYRSGVVGLSGSETRSTNRYHWLEMPINAVYTVRGIQVFAGPYVAMALGGRQKGTTLQTAPNVRYAPLQFDEKAEYGPNTSNRRFDAGVNAGIGYRRGPVQMQLGYGLGLLNLHQLDADYTIDSIHNFREDAAYNRVVQFTGTYFFEL